MQSSAHHIALCQQTAVPALCQLYLQTLTRSTYQLPCNVMWLIDAQKPRQDHTCARGGQAVAALWDLTKSQAKGPNLKGACGGALVCRSSRYSVWYQCHQPPSVAKCRAASRGTASAVHSR